MAVNIAAVRLSCACHEGSIAVGLFGDWVLLWQCRQLCGITICAHCEHTVLRCLRKLSARAAVWVLQRVHLRRRQCAHAGRRRVCMLNLAGFNV